MANFPSSVAVAATPATPTPAPAPVVVSVSQALSPADAPEAAPVLPQGVVDANEAKLAAEGTTTAPALDANPYKTAATLEARLSDMGVDPVLAKFYGGRFQQALLRPAPTAEQLATGHAEAEAALANEYGEDAEHVGRLAREEMHRMACDYPELPALLERTGLGNDLQVIKAIASRGYERLMAQKRTEFGLPPQGR